MINTTDLPLMKIPPELLQQCIFIAGPTACGKSAFGLFLAKKLGGEILSMDSMSIYRGMDIGTAKPSVEERQLVPHHLIDLVDPDVEYSTAQFFAAAQQEAINIRARGQVPIFVGGTGLYLRSLLRGVFEGPPADWEFRNELIERAQGEPENWLHEQLRQVDPVSAARLHPNDSRRLIRALEITRLAGQPASQLQQEVPLPPELRPQRVYWLHPPRDWLHNRINRRVEQMFEQGLEAEVGQLLAGPQPLSKSASQALGYREVIDWIEGRIPSQADCIELIQTRTRQFAKRQHTWFRNLIECHEICMSGTESAEELFELLPDDICAGDA